MIFWFTIGIVIGWLLSFIYGWNRRAYYEDKEFKRGFELGRKIQIENAKQELARLLNVSPEDLPVSVGEPK